jgi:hypothetical protein
MNQTAGEADRGRPMSMLRTSLPFVVKLPVELAPDFKMSIQSIATTPSSLNRTTTATIAGSPSRHNTLDEVDLLMPEGQHQQIKSFDPSIDGSFQPSTMIFEQKAASQLFTNDRGCPLSLLRTSNRSSSRRTRSVRYLYCSISPIVNLQHLQWSNNNSCLSSLIEGYGYDAKHIHLVREKPSLHIA